VTVTASNANHASRSTHPTRTEVLGSSRAARHDPISSTEVQLARLSGASQGTE